MHKCSSGDRQGHSNFLPIILFLFLFVFSSSRRDSRLIQIKQDLKKTFVTMKKIGWMILMVQIHHGKLSLHNLYLILNPIWKNGENIHQLTR